MDYGIVPERFFFLLSVDFSLLLPRHFANILLSK